MPLLEAHHYQLYKLLLVPLKRRLLIRVFIENDAGITVGDCEKVSRLINDMIFTENLVESAYVLEVSSPGIDRPLEKLKDFQRNIGRKLRVFYQQSDQAHSAEGILEEAADSGIRIDRGKKGSLSLEFSQITKANVLPKF